LLLFWLVDYLIRLVIRVVSKNFFPDKVSFTRRSQEHADILGLFAIDSDRDLKFGSP
jgi:hypothetical protein